MRTTAGSFSGFASRRTLSSSRRWRGSCSAPKSKPVQGVDTMGQSRDMALAAGTAASRAARRQEILARLTAANKQLSPTWFYDERGSQLFDEICTLPEYYAT